MTHMDECSRPHRARLAASLLSLSCAWAALAMAQAPSTNQETPATVVPRDQIVQGLKSAPAAPTRSLSFAPSGPTRGLDRKPGSASHPSVNLNIPFEYNSSTLKPQANAQLEALKDALTDPELSKQRIMVAGHTDAKGSADYNKQLSLRRAETVKHYLVQNGIDPQRLDTVGYGSEQLLTPDHPDDPSNRRVEIRTVTAQ